MKKYVFILTLLACGSVWSQTPADTTDTEENVIGGRVERRNTQRESNVLGTPVYYNLDGSVRQGRRNNNPRPQGEYLRPDHHYRNTLKEHYNTYFCEFEGLFGAKDVAIGMNFTYLPERWGIYGSMLVGMRYNFASLGAAYRMSDKQDFMDLQLYGGLIYGDGLGGEFGMRLAGTRSKSGFGWCSGSMGGAVMDGRGYFTLGLSLDITALTALSLMLFTW